MFKNWITAMRLRTLPLAAAGILAGSAGLKPEIFSSSVFVLALLTALALQIFSNLANDYGDFQNGADGKDRVGPARMVQSGKITAEQMKRGLYVSGSLAFALGVLLLNEVFVVKKNWVGFGVYLGIGIAAIWAAFKYTAGKNPYGYKGLGDFFVFLFFGVVSVLSMSYFLSGKVGFIAILNTIIVGMLSMAVLHLNNLRDYISDAKAGKNTLVVKLGFANGKRLHFVWLSVAFLAGVAEVFITPSHYAFYLLPFVILVAHAKKVFSCTNPQLLDSELKKVALSTFAIALLLLIFLPNL
jgi:1,4-dihydroxy-2-naphthoate octaprenyltransferase